MCVARAHNGPMSEEIEQVADAPANARYEISIDGELVGFTEYRDHGSVREIYHTEVLPGWEGRGLGSRLLKGALDDVRAQGKKVTPTCPMLAGYIGKHPEEQDLVA